MVTVIHQDGDDLALTHYCALGNQPRRTGGITQRLDAIGREKAGVAFLGIPSWANAHIWVKEPIKSINDLRSRKVRSHPSYDPLVKGLGIPTVNVPFSELFTALERGVIDGIAYPYYDIKTYGLEKVLKYRIDPPFWRAGWVVMLANAKQFDNLPKDVQQIEEEHRVACGAACDLRRSRCQPATHRRFRSRQWRVLRGWHPAGSGYQERLTTTYRSDHAGKHNHSR